ncbi:TIGR03032 family protein [Noviherbaspirillum denitrificans]|uniref:Conserved hypothetical protein CHP03032 domain-containing protein n=1 Tax=Noviherbaspirillum denitrificans TaxID=1968433 RepID=A0A254TDR8_9BURK|nr:TIGR03032 family protein [Noviherbaspirillum denitrificans]OWW20685.1 hypothetical protein AYR66_15525 [Noviherbaspirillum denitrificans]
MSDTTNRLNDWNAADLARSGFSADGKRLPPSEQPPQKPQLVPSPGLAEWLWTTGGSLLFSTYQSGRLFMLGNNPDRSLHAIERVVGTSMGLAIDRDKLWVGTREQIWRFSNTGADDIGGQAYDAIYMPRHGYFVGNSNTHDVIADVSFRGERFPFLYANTQFSCVATVDEHYTFRPVWVPDFISSLAPEDRCHLNGICARDGELRYATVCGRSDTRLGWKASKSHGGFVVDIATGETVCSGLSMPHSPRWHDGKLWLINSGEAELGYVDFDTGRFKPVALCHGFARGLAFVDGYAVVALSRLRPEKNGLVGDINLEQRLEERGFYQRCGLLVIDLATGKLAHWLSIEGPVTELYDVVFNPGIRRPYSPGFREPEQHTWRIHLPPGPWKDAAKPPADFQGWRPRDDKS